MLFRSRRYPLKLIENWIYEKDLEKVKEHYTESTKSVCIYARVSTYRQNTDGNLDRQAERLEKFARKRFGNIKLTIIKEYGSGLNPNRAGLWRVIRKIKKGEISSVIVSYPDRLSRFGIPFLEEIFHTYGVSLIVAEEQNKPKTIEEELVNDLMKLMASFSGKLYKSRALSQSANERSEKKEAKIISDLLSKSIIQSENDVVENILTMSQKY